MSGYAYRSEYGQTSFALPPEEWLIYCCPRCHSPLRRDNDDSASCQHAACRCHQPGSFPIIDGRPALIDFDDSVVDRDTLVAEAGASVIPRDPSWLVAQLRRLASGSENRVAADNFRLFHDELLRSVGAGRRPRMLVVGGGHLGANLEDAYAADDIDILCFDIYRSDLTDFIADAHRIPLIDRSIDGVWIQAVLEHVLSPEQVVAEIHRVLTPAGIVYAETPFMQQVHEGAYDFTRFSPSGHRWLFRHFDEIAAGVVAGAGTSLLWAIRHFWRDLTGSTRFATLATVPFFWLNRFDRIGATAGGDGANGTYFLGRKSATALTPKDIVRYYRGHAAAADEKA
jgi:SAM-dependent methyltransferase